MAEEEAEKPKEMIKLVSKEGHEFSVEKQAAMVSNNIKSTLTGCVGRPRVTVASCKNDMQ